MDNPELKLLLCVYHLEKSDHHKLSQLHPKKGAANKILADIYGSNVHGLYFNNNIESMHFKEKTEQCHKLGSSIGVIKTLKKIIDRQQDDKVHEIYGSGPYKLSREYGKFSIDNLK